MSVTTPITTLLGIQHPILLAGMGQTSGPALAAAVSNAGGLGVIGGVGYTPTQLRALILELKSLLNPPSLPFGIDILLPQVGGPNARPTNYDYTSGKLREIIEVVVDSGARLFVSAVGLPPRWAVDRLHEKGVLYMNMVGHPRHVVKACEQAGADLICAQGGEAGGHTGEVPTSVLVPACADICARYTSPLTKQPVGLVAAGGIADGRGVASVLMLGAAAAWIGTRFVVAVESGASEQAKRGILGAGFGSTIKSTIWTGRQLRSLRTDYVSRWEDERREEQRGLLAKGVLPFDHDADRLMAEDKWTDEIEEQSTVRPMGVVSALVNKPGQGGGEIVEEMARETVEALRQAAGWLGPKGKL